MSISLIFFKMFSILIYIFCPYYIYLLKVLVTSSKMYKQYRSLINLEIGLALTIIGLLFPPKGDILEYYFIFEKLRFMNFREFVEFLKNQSDYMFYVLQYGFILCGFSFKAFQGIILLIGNILWMKLLTEFQNKEKSNEYFYLMLFLLFNLPIYFMYRSMMASLLISYGVYLYLNGRKKSGICYIILSILWHKSMLFILAIFILGYSFRNKSKIRLFIIGLLCSFLLYKSGTLIAEYLFPRFYKYYVLGYWNKEFLKQMNINAKITLFFPTLRYIAVIYLYIISLLKKEVKESYFNLGIGTVLMVLMCFFSVIGFIRLLYSFTLLILVINMSELKRDSLKYNKLLKIAIILVLILCYIIQLLEYRQFIMNIDYFSIFTESFYKIFINN